PCAASARFFTSLGTEVEGFFRDESFLAGTAMASCDLSVEESRGSGHSRRGREYAASRTGASPAGCTAQVPTAKLLGLPPPPCSDPRVVPARLVLVAAGRHLAPAASSVLAGVEEQPPTSVQGRGLAQTDAPAGGSREPLRRRPGEPGNEGIEPGRLRGDPPVAVVGGTHQPPLGPRAANLLLQHLEGLGRGLRALGNGEEDSKKSLAKGPHAVEG